MKVRENSRSRLPSFVLALLVSLSMIGAASAGNDQSDPVASFAPDPASVERYGPAYRYPQAGWIVLHIEGEPYERGYQHGRLLSPEISEIVRAAALNQSPKAPDDGWNQMRTLVDALFLRRYDEEYLLEMKGIADGAAAAGAKFESRPLDLVDIVAVNAWTEVEFLDAALRATPQGLEGTKFRDLLPMPVKAPPPSRCSSFIATGPATADGKIVFGHITMWSLQPARHFNVWLDLKPAKGHRVLMQTYPGGIQSSMDYYFNDAGLLVSETTLAQTRFNINGQTEASRIRRALQYSDSIDGAVEILKKSNNGLYTNEWLIGDTKTNEIAMFELGTHKSRLYRSSKNEWFGDTPGFFWGCNNTKDIEVRLETVPSLVDKPANVVFRPSDRDIMWQRLYTKHKGKINEAFGFEAFTTPPLAAAHSLDAKFTTTDLAGQLKTWALFGPPLGRTWEPTEGERGRYGENIKPLVSNGWTLLEAKAPAVGSEEPERTKAVDLASSSGRASLIQPSGHSIGGGTHGLVASASVWHGTILPKTSGDTWLAAAFADYERVVSLDKSLGSRQSFSSLGDAARDGTNLALFPYRSTYLVAARTLPTTSLAEVRSSTTSNDWYDLASGKGLFVLAELRALMGDAKFADFMDAFGREFAGKSATTEEFRTRAERAAGQSLGWFFDQWIGRPGTPSLKLRNVELSSEGSNWSVRGIIEQPEPAYRTQVELCLETPNGPVTQVVALGEKAVAAFDVSTSSRPKRLLVDPCNRLLKTNGGVFSTHSFQRELDVSLIVYGTSPEAASLREAAELLERRIATQWSNISVPIKSDREVSEEDLKTNHLLLVGRPSMNSLVQRFRKNLPVQFGAGSFAVADQTYAHPSSAVIAAAENPANPRYSIVVFAGLSAESTRRAVQRTPPVCEVVVLPANSGPQSLVLSADELVVEFPTHD